MSYEEDVSWRLPCGHAVLEKEQVHYCDYLSLVQLVSLMKPHAASVLDGSRAPRDLGDPDELQFIGIHQAFEIEFVVHADALRWAITAVDADHFDEATSLVGRAIKATKVYVALAAQLMTMPPKSFLRFRDLLLPVSSTESEGFRIVELLSGITPQSFYGTPFPEMPLLRYRQFLERPLGKDRGKMPSQWWTPRMSEVVQERNLATSFLDATARHGFTPRNISQDCSLGLLATALRSYESSFLGFRKIHLEMVIQQLGEVVPGLGNTSGAKFLESVIKNARLFPFFDEKSASS